jgi:putative membrane protein
MQEVYCGPAPTPASLSGAWSLDLVALAAASAFVIAHLATRRDGRLSLTLGVGLFLLLFLSPLCALTAALFSARAVHHVLLAAVVAPFLVVAFGGLSSARRPPLSVGGSLALSTIAMWVWHVPPLYDAAITSAPLYWLMQVTLLCSGGLFWWAVLSPSAWPGAALIGLLGAVVQMGMLGALLTFAGRPLYAAHALTTGPFGLSPLEDQQLAGLILWVPAAGPYVAAAVLIALRMPPVARGMGGERSADA